MAPAATNVKIKRDGIIHRVFTYVIGAVIIMMLGLVVDDRKALAAKNAIQDERITQIAAQQQKESAEIQKKLEVFIQRFDALQGYPNSASGLKKDIMDEVRNELKTQNELFNRMLTGMEKTIDSKFEIVLLAVRQNTASLDSTIRRVNTIVTPSAATTSETP